MSVLAALAMIPRSVHSPSSTSFPHRRWRVSSAVSITTYGSTTPRPPALHHQQWNARIRIRAITANGFGRGNNDLGPRSSLVGGRRTRIGTQLIGIALFISLAGGPQAVAMLAGEAS